MWLLSVRSSPGSGPPGSAPPGSAPPGSGPPDAGSPPSPPDPPRPRPARPSGFCRYLYTQNPFYVISAVLMLFAVRSAYGRLEIGYINTWVMWGVLAGYTAVLAGIAVALVRWGRVWDDARSLLVLLVVLFLAVSIGADDLFANAEHVESAVVLAVCGYLFSAVVSEAVIRGAGIRLGFWLRVPYHALLALFYAAPGVLSSHLSSRDPATQSWMLLAFPAVAGGLLLLLWPAARRGPAYTANNGTPYPWPWFPWTAFGLFAAAVGFRSYVLSMTFGLVGPIWGKGRTIVFDTIWGPYFLVPVLLAVLVLVLETAIVVRRRELQQSVLQLAPLLLVLCLPMMRGQVHRTFLAEVTATIGSPLWLGSLTLIGFYAWAAVRRVPWAFDAAVASVLLLAVIGPGTVDLRTTLEPTAWPLLVVGACLFARGVWMRSSPICTFALLPIAAGIWLGVSETSLAGYRFSVTYHAVWLAVVVIGLVFRDDFARVLRVVGSGLSILTVLLVLATEQLVDVPILLRVAYVAAVTTGCLVIARVFRLRSYLYAFFALLTLGVYGGVVVGFRAAVAVYGWEAVTAFSWSVGTLLLAVLISAHKARWLPARLLPRRPRE